MRKNKIKAKTRKRHNVETKKYHKNKKTKISEYPVCKGKEKNIFPLPNNTYPLISNDYLPLGPKIL